MIEWHLAPDDATHYLRIHRGLNVPPYHCWIKRTNNGWFYKTFGVIMGWNDFNPPHDQIQQFVERPFNVNGDKAMLKAKDIKNSVAYKQLRDAVARNPVRNMAAQDVLGKLTKRFLAGVNEQHPAWIEFDDKLDVDFAITWHRTQEGQDFWSDIHNGNRIDLSVFPNKRKPVAPVGGFDQVAGGAAAVPVKKAAEKPKEKPIAVGWWVA